jgi:hypothetical protein
MTIAHPAITSNIHQHILKIKHLKDWEINKELNSNNPSFRELYNSKSVIYHMGIRETEFK